MARKQSRYELVLRSPEKLLDVPEVEFCKCSIALKHCRDPLEGQAQNSSLQRQTRPVMPNLCILYVIVCFIQ